MKNWLLILPVAFVVSYSQIVIKWRVSHREFIENASVIELLINYLKDPFVVSAYTAALVGSFGWLFVITKLPLAIAFPAYVGVTFCMVAVGSVLLLGEQMSANSVLAIVLIISGLIIGIRG